MRGGGGVSGTLYIHIAADRLDIRLAVNVPRLNSKTMTGEFPDVEANPDNHGKQRMYAGEITRDNGIERSHYGQFTAVFLSKITKGKQFYFHGRPPIPLSAPLAAKAEDVSKY
jgi:hypothetical protein